MIDIPNFNEVYQMRSAAIATYPMYRGIARLIGMDVLKTGSTIESEFQTLKENFNAISQGKCRECPMAAVS